MDKGLKLLGVAVAAALLSACLVPQNDDPLPEIPPAKNNRPRILLDTVQPGEAMDVTLYIATVSPSNVPCPKVTFSVKVEDLDLADPISSKWRAMRIAPSLQTPQEPWTDGTAVPFMGSTTALRPNPITPGSSFLKDWIRTEGTYRIEVVVSDGTLIDPGNGVLVEQPLPRIVMLPDGGVFQELAARDSYVWTVNAEMNCP
jgi:hypothetical protein